MDTVILIRSAIRGLVKVVEAAFAAELRAALGSGDDYATSAKPMIDWDHLPPVGVHRQPGQRRLRRLPSLGQGEGRRSAARILGAEGSNPSSLKLCRTALTRSGEVKATMAIWATYIPWAESNTIWALRHRTIEPDERRTIWSRRLPSSLLISRTRIPSRT